MKKNLKKVRHYQTLERALYRNASKPIYHPHFGTLTGFSVLREGYFSGRMQEPVKLVFNEERGNWNLYFE